MSKAYSLDKDGLDHRLEILRELAKSIAAEIDGIVGADNGTQTDVSAEPQINLEEQVRKFESDLIRFALFKAGGHQTRAAKLLGINVSTLSEKLKRHRISVLGFRPRGVDVTDPSKSNML